MIDIENATVVYRKKWIGLEDASLKVGKGEFVFLVGSSGAGKSTVLRLIYMDVFPAKGQVTVLGKNTSTIRRPHIPYIRRKIGVIFQDFKLLKDRTVFDNVMFALEVTGSPAKKRKKKSLEVLNALGIVHRRNEYPFSLSGGEQQKVAIARAFMRDSKILILDEPTASLDARTEYEIFKHFKELSKDKISILISHRFSTVRMADRIYVLEDGRIVEQGSHKDLMQLKGKYAKMFTMQAERYVEKVKTKPVQM